MPQDLPNTEEPLFLSVVSDLGSDPRDLLEHEVRVAAIIRSHRSQLLHAQA